MKNAAAIALGKLARGIPKQFSRSELNRRRERMKIVAKNRWPKKEKP